MVTLREKFRGCIAASWIGSAMGAVVEGWSREKIQQTYGFLDRLVSYKHYVQYTDWQRPPGTTEDGIERQRLMTTAIIDKQGRIKAEDLAAVWVRDLDPAKIAYKQEPFDKSLLEAARAGVPAADIGRLWPFPNVVSLARSSHPIGLINAADPRAAADDCYEVGKLYMQETAFGIRWAALYNAAIAEACRPGATVDSVVEAALDCADYRAEATRLFRLYDNIKDEVTRAVEIASRHTDPVAMRDEFYQHYYGGHHFNYHMSQANEIVSKGLAVFALSKGDPKQAILTAVNFGRDTDCLAAVAGGLSGALSGPGALAAEWIEQVNEATRRDPYTNNKRTVEEAADGLFEAYLAQRRRAQQLLEDVSDPAYLA